MTFRLYNDNNKDKSIGNY